jgi:type VI secretion system protein ImpA
MPSESGLDLEQLLTPIPGVNPAGVSLRDDFSPTSVYHAIKDARSAARAAERNVVWGDDTPDLRAPWRSVADLGPRILAEKSKDLEVTAWLIEALVRLRGYAGLRDGFRLARELIERFWDGLYPLPDEEGLQTRVAPLAGLNGEEAEGTLVRPIFGVPVTGDSGERPLTVSDYQQACDLDRMADPDKRAQRIAQGAATMEMFRRAVLETSAEFYGTLIEDLQGCSQEFERLRGALESRCGKDPRGYDLAPPTSNIRNALEACRDAIRHLAKDRLPAAEGADAEQNDGALATLDGAGSPGRSLQRVHSRDDAFRALLQVADFFKRTEPHSPVSYALEQAVRWGRMPLPELLTELIPEESARGNLFRLVGIQPPENRNE